MPLPEIDVAFGCGDAPWTVLVAKIREEISALYEADVIVSSALDAPPPDAMLGQPAVLELTRAGTVRRLKGVVRRVEDLGSTASHRFAKVVVVPRLWALTQRVDTRIFQEMSVVDIVRAVVHGAVLYTGENELRFPGALSQHPAREYCVQYGESDLKFALRLLQEEGVAHYFTHDGDGTEALHLAEDGHTYPEVDVMGGGPTVDVVDANAATVSREGVTMFQLGSELRPTGLMIRDYDFTRPRAMLDMSPSFPSERGGRPMYEYPSRVSLYEYDDETRAYPMHDGGRQARVRFEAQQVAARVGSGRGLVTAFIPGGVFELRGHLRSELDQRYLLLSVEHRVRAFDTMPEEVRLSRTLLAAMREAGFDVEIESMPQRYENTFRCIPASVVYRPLRTLPRPIVHGIQTARVVGPAGEEIFTDFHGRIKVQFHWDRLGQENEQSSCWIRVAQSWGGAGWGFTYIPRIGMEVVVTFLEGDPDRPLVISSVYNGENNSPYELPGDKTRSTLKSSSSPQTGGFNELRFEDLAGQEQIFMQAERNHDVLVKNDQSVTVGRHRVKSVEANESNAIGNNRQTMVGGNESKEVMGNQDSQVHGLSGASLGVDMNYSVNAGVTLSLTVGDSSILMTRKEIVLKAETIRVHGKKLVEIKGGLVKINCPDGDKPKTAQPPNLAAAMQRGFGAAIAGLPGPLQALVSKFVGGAIQQVVGALMSGQRPNLGNLLSGFAQGAVGALAGPALQAVSSALGPAGPIVAQVAGQAVQRVLQQTLGPAPSPSEPGGPEALALRASAMESTERGVLRSLEAAHLLRQGLADTPGWREVETAHPAVAQAALRRAATPHLRASLQGVQADDNAESRRVLSGSSAAGRAGVDAGIGAMLGGG
jgi:type VI secretion system secreted protein VgrG